MKYEFIYNYRFAFAVKKLCRVLEVSRSGYYSWVGAGRPHKQDKDVVLLALIRKVERENGNNYGVRRVHRALNDSHKVRCSRSKIQRVMHQNGIRA